MYQQFTSNTSAPVLANLTEFGQTPLFTLDELRSVDIAIALYPLSAFRAMNKAAEQVYTTLRKEGTQKVSFHLCRLEKSCIKVFIITIMNKNWMRYFPRINLNF